ncbi:mediator of RNA polymerase II transcription subunit 25-like [Vigna angularis]|uniref:mediator of RNA polymerase II transcription subunit 25-like n=1 Tax=Phaseolus angularis TaxID=3914 RepID=UPI0022B3B241|nr:mediator of RNA polymerase II transcription subunit 25-like [Vigna angularis]
MNIGQPSIQGFQNVRRESASKLPLVAPQVTSEMHAPSTGCFVPMDSFAELMSLLSDDNNDYQQDQPRKKSKTSVPTSEEEDSLAYLFQLDQPVSLDEILGQGQSLFSKTQVGGESSQVLRDIVPQSVTRGSASTIQLTSNSSERMNISISPGIVACTSSGSSNGLAHELGGNMGVVNPMFSSELNCLNSSLSLPQNNPKFWPAGSNALFPPQTAASFGDSTFLNTIENSNIQFESSSFPMLQYGSASAESSSSDFGNSLTQFQYPNSSVNPYDCASVGPIGSSIVGDRAGGSTLDGNSFSQFQPPSFPVHRYGSLTAGVACASASTDAIVVTSASAANGSANLYGSRQQFTKRNQFEMRGIDPLGVPSAMVPNPSASPVPIMPQCNQTQLLPRQPFLPDFQDFMPAWEGYLVGSIHPYCAFFNQAKAWRKKTSPVTITYQWSTTLEIALYLPKKAVMHTMRTYGGILDDVLFEVTQFDNLDLYHHLTSNNLCAKIALPSHTLTLSTTENKHCYTGSIFPGDAVFVEPL